jgi:ribonuclease E
MQPPSTPPATTSGTHPDVANAASAAKVATAVAVKAAATEASGATRRRSRSRAPRRPAAGRSACQRPGSAMAGGQPCQPMAPRPHHAGDAAPTAKSAVSAARATAATTVSDANAPSSATASPPRRAHVPSSRAPWRTDGSVTAAASAPSKRRPVVAALRTLPAVATPLPTPAQVTETAVVHEGQKRRQRLLSLRQQLHNIAATADTAGARRWLHRYPHPPHAPTACRKVAPFRLPLGELDALAQAAGLQWVNSDADKVASRAGRHRRRAAAHPRAARASAAGGAGRRPAGAG